MDCGEHDMGSLHATALLCLASRQAEAREDASHEVLTHPLVISVSDNRMADKPSTSSPIIMAHVLFLASAQPGTYMPPPFNLLRVK